MISANVLPSAYGWNSPIYSTRGSHTPRRRSNSVSYSQERVSNAQTERTRQYSFRSRSNSVSYSPSSVSNAQIERMRRHSFDVSSNLSGYISGCERSLSGALVENERRRSIQNSMVVRTDESISSKPRNSYEWSQTKEAKALDAEADLNPHRTEGKMSVRLRIVKQEDNTLSGFFNIFNEKGESCASRRYIHGHCFVSSGMVGIPIEKTELRYRDLVDVADNFFCKNNVPVNEKALIELVSNAKNSNISIEVVDEFGRLSHIDERCYQSRR